MLAAVQLVFTYAPFMQGWFGTAAIDHEAWLRIMVCATGIFFIVEGEKWLLWRRPGRV
jgi:hypothetical protein